MALVYWGLRGKKMKKWFFEQAILGNVYHSHNTTAGAVTVLSATATGLILENPFGSGKDLIVKVMAFVGSTLTTIRELGVAVSPSVSTVVSTTTTAAVIHNAKLAGSDIRKGVGRAYSIATLPAAPVWFRPLGSARVTAAVDGLPALLAEFDGDVIVTPGTNISFAALTLASTGLCSITWAEINATP
jgi:hypothetical protein